MTKIYTRTGDGGLTSLYDGQRIPKFKTRMEVVGTLDELNASLGVALTEIDDAAVREQVTSIQNTLFNIGAEVAEGATKVKRMIPDSVRVDAGRDRELENWIDRFDQQLKPLTTFILPGGSAAGSRIHLTRTVCRRAERQLSRLAEEETINPHSLVFINRLSDYLFVAARFLNVQAGLPETPWDKHSTEEK